MEKISVPPSPNWYLSQVTDCSERGVLAYGSRESIVLYHEDKNSFSYISHAHKGRIMSVQFAPAAVGNKLVSCGEDCVVCIWDLEFLQGTVAHIVHTSSKHAPVASWSRADPNLIVSADTAGYIVSWNLQKNLTRSFHFKLSFTVVECSPHNGSIVGLGTKGGMLYVMDVSGKGRVIHKLRGHDTDIVSLAWCPVKENIFKPSEEDTCLLASGARDTTIYLWRTGSDGRYEKAVHMPSAPAPDSGHRAQLPSGTGLQGSWTAVCWPEPGTLVASTLWGELVAQDLLAQPQPSEVATPGARAGTKNKSNNWRLLHGKHARGLFSIACRPYSGKSDDDSQAEKVVWTAGQDRQLIACTLVSGNVLRAMATLGAPIYSMAISPIDGSRLAVGVGDKSIRIWNLTDPNPDSMVTLWNKIAGKVYSLAWHPKKEGCLAYGTSDGRIGLYDTMSTKPPVLFRLHFTQPVYTLQWGPNINLRGAIGSGEAAEAGTVPKEEQPPAKKSDCLLYAVADNQACAFDPDKPLENPVNLKYILRGSDAVANIKLGRKRTGLSWKPDYSLLAVGNEDGTVHLLTPHEETGLRHVRTVSVHSKLIQDLAWHPPSTSDEVLRSYLNWLAVASNESEVRVVDVSNLLANVADIKVDVEALPVPVVAVLKGHSQRVVSVTWNPHVSGQLLSMSYDESAVIWDVASQQALRHFSAHDGVVLCGLWSLLDPDLVLTGSGDATLRVWQVSAQNEGRPTAKKQAKPYLGAKQALPDKSFDTSDNRTRQDKPPRLLEGTSVEVAKSEESLRQDRKKMKERSLFPVSGPLMNEPSHLLKNLQRLIADEGTVTNGGASQQDVAASNGNVSPKSEHKEENFGATAFFGDNEAVAQLLERERSALVALEHFDSAFTLDIWRSKIKDAVEEATKNHRLTDHIVSLSPMASIKVWQAACLAYAEQLCHTGEYVRSAGYYLAVHKVEEAVNMLMEKGLSRQAIVVAKSRLAAGDPFVKGLMEKWAQQKIQEGQHEMAANCLASLGEWAEAADVLARRKNVPHLCVAAQLASRGGAHDKAASIFLNALKLNDDEHWDLVTSCLANLKNQEHLTLLVAVLKLLSKRFKERLDPEQWLKGTFKNEDRSFEFDFGGKISEMGGKVVISRRLDLPLQKLLNSGLSLSSREETLLTVSVNLALAISCAPKCFTDLPEGIACSEEDQDVHEAMRRFVQAMAALSSYALRDPDSGHLLLKLCILLSPKGPTHPGSIFSEESSISPAQKSLRAYLCTGVLNWLMENGSSFIPPKKEVYADRKPALKARRRVRGREARTTPKTDQQVEEPGQPVVLSIDQSDATSQSAVQSVHQSAEQVATHSEETAGSARPTVESTKETADNTVEPATASADPPVDSTTESADPPVGTTKESAEPPVDSTKESAEPPVDSTEESADPPVDSTKESAEPPVDSTKESAEPPVDSTKESAEPPVDSTKESADSPVDSTKKTADPLVDSTKESADPPVDSTKESADPPVDLTTESADPPVGTTKETADLPLDSTKEAANQLSDPTANHTAEPLIETADQTCESIDQADTAESVEDGASANYPKPAWIQALDLIKRYSQDLFSYNNMRYFSDNVRIKVLLHKETSATKEKLSSSRTQPEKSKNDGIEETKQEVKEENGTEDRGAGKGEDRGEDAGTGGGEESGETKKDDSGEKKKEGGEETKKEGDEVKKEGGEETKKEGDEESKEEGDEESKEEGGEETKKEGGEDARKEGGEEAKKGEGEERKSGGGEEPKEDEGREQSDISENKEKSESALTERQREIKQLQDWFASFEKDQVIVPNPFVSYSNLNLVLNETLAKVDKKEAETYAEYFKNVWEGAKANNVM